MLAAVGRRRLHARASGRRLAAAAFVHTATYDVAVASLDGQRAHRHRATGPASRRWIGATWDKAAVLRYGENPHQRAALYRNGTGAAAWPRREQLHGKEMSYNNYVDADAARRAAYDFDEPAVAIIKHANPCGIAVGADIAEAHRKAHACDPVSAFGGVIATNRPVTAAMAQQVAEIFTEVIVAPGVRGRRGRGARSARRTSGSWWSSHAPPAAWRSAADRRRPADAAASTPSTPRATTRRRWTLAAGERGRPDDARRPRVRLAGLRAVKSNAILLAHDGASVGVGMGQVNRVDSCRLAVSRAGDRARVGRRVRRVLPVRRRARRS